MGDCFNKRVFAAAVLLGATLCAGAAERHMSGFAGHASFGSILPSARMAMLVSMMFFTGASLAAKTALARAGRPVLTWSGTLFCLLGFFGATIGFLGGETMGLAETSGISAVVLVLFGHWNGR